jgi:hypothetical protein
VARSNGLSGEEREALRTLQQGDPVPLAEEPVWDYLVSASLVRIDRDVHPHQVRLTPQGLAYLTTE